MEHNVAGGFDEEHFALLSKNKNRIGSLAQQILEAHFPESIQEEIADEMGFDIQQIRKVRDPLFRQQVLRAYNYECAICGFNMRHDNASVGLEAAHIKWKQFGGPCEIPNGLALCAIHHKAFDKGSIGLDESMRVLVSEAVNGGGIVGWLFWDFAGKQITLPMVKGNYPKEGYVEWHRREVFRGWMRRPDSNYKFNTLNFKQLINNKLLMYTQLYTQLLSFENQRITKYMNQPKDDAAIILGSIISARDVLTIGRMPASFTLL